MNSYRQLEGIFEKLYDLGGAAAMLNWDSAAMMPPGGALARADQLAVLHSISHETITSKRVADLLGEAEKDIKKLGDWQQANLKLMRHKWLHANALDNGFVREFSKAASECENVWRTARADNDFKKFRPYLQKILEMVREAASLKAGHLKCSSYDALIDQFDQGRKSAEIDKIFSELEKFLPSFIKTVVDYQRTRQDFIPIEGKFPAEAQKNLGLKLMKALGFDFTYGRIDSSHHPFCGGVYGDVRITTRYDEKDFTSALMGILHETGHALYENGLPQKWHKQPVGHALGMSIHESQSLLIEMQVCRSHEFLIYAAPLIARAFGGKGNAWQAENLHKIYNRVEPGLIRVDADEVTYPVHIILRYKLEKALISGDMEAEDIPPAWNKMMKDMLGIKVPNDRMGCMQDIHWTDGSFGYFPSYTLGAIHAAQFFSTAKKDDPSILPNIKTGNFLPLRNWLRDNIYALGSKLTAGELLKKVTGENINTEIYKNYLKNKYLS